MQNAVSPPEILFAMTSSTTTDTGGNTKAGVKQYGRAYSSVRKLSPDLPAHVRPCGRSRRRRCRDRCCRGRRVRGLVDTREWPASASVTGRLWCTRRRPPRPTSAADAGSVCAGNEAPRRYPGRSRLRPALTTTSWRVQARFGEAALFPIPSNRDWGQKL